MEDTRAGIIETYARWTALSALRSGAPIKSRKDVYSAIAGVGFDILFDDRLGPITRSTFDLWHESTVGQMVVRDARLNVGWAAKIVNVYLKTRAYVGSQGRDHLIEMIHPPLDSGLWAGLQRRFPTERHILDQTHCVTRIKDINDYGCYRTIIDGCRTAATALDCKLIEVEQLWESAEVSPRASGVS